MLLSLRRESQRVGRQALHRKQVSLARIALLQMLLVIDASAACSASTTQAQRPLYYSNNWNPRFSGCRSGTTAPRIILLRAAAAVQECEPEDCLEGAEILAGLRFTSWDSASTVAPTTSGAQLKKAPSSKPPSSKPPSKATRPRAAVQQLGLDSDEEQSDGELGALYAGLYKVTPGPGVFWAWPRFPDMHLPCALQPAACIARLSHQYHQ